jgi:ABC-type dipeptide/oligopeptide/nickel transport system ATPase component
MTEPEGDPRVNQVLTVRDLQTSLVTSSGSFPILRGIDLDLRQGETLGIVGPSGSGKSILAKSVMRLIRPPGEILSGEVRLLDGRDVLTIPESELRTVRGSLMSLIVPDARNHLNPLVTVGAQIANVYRAHHKVSKKEALERAVDMLSRVGIAGRAGAYPHELSGGMAQRIVICMALINSPKVLIADEPTFGLDVTIQRQVLELFHSLLSELDSATIILTRDMGIVAQYCRRVGSLAHGTLEEPLEVKDFFEQHAHDLPEETGPDEKLVEPVPAAPSNLIVEELPSLGLVPDLPPRGVADADAERREGS